jgi:hypothetical protein
MRVSNEDSSLWQSHQQGRLLEKAKQFEHDYDDDNYSDYVEDASVHALTDIRVAVRWPAFMQTERPPKPA